MASSAVWVPLRPLGVGEIFDRAVTLYVRNAAAFSIIALCLVLPVRVVSYFVSSASARTFTTVLATLTHPSAHATLPSLDPGAQAATFALLLIYALATPFVTIATALGVAALYAGEPFSWTRCYRRAFARWPATLLLVFVAISIVIGVWFVSAIVLAFGAAIAAVVFIALRPLGVILFLLVGVLLLAIVALLVALWICCNFMFLSATIEEIPAGEAIAVSFNRVFGGGEARKALLVGLGLFAIYIGEFAVQTTALVYLRGLLHRGVLDAAIETIAALVVFSFTAVTTAVYYYDVRVRREGLDLERALGALATGG